MKKCQYKKCPTPDEPIPSNATKYHRDCYIVVNREGATKRWKDGGGKEEVPLGYPAYMLAYLKESGCVDNVHAREKVWRQR